MKTTIQEVNAAIRPMGYVIKRVSGLNGGNYLYAFKPINDNYPELKFPTERVIAFSEFTKAQWVADLAARIAGKYISRWDGDVPTLSSK